LRGLDFPREAMGVAARSDGDLLTPEKHLAPVGRSARSRRASVGSSAARSGKAVREEPQAKRLRSGRGRAGPASIPEEQETPLCSDAQPESGLLRLEEPGEGHTNIQLTGHLPGEGRIPAWMQIYSSTGCTNHQEKPTYASQDGNYLLYSSSGPGVGQGWWLGNAADGTASAAALAFLPRGHAEWWVLDGGAPREARVVITTASPTLGDASGVDAQPSNPFSDSSTDSTASKGLMRLEEPGGNHFQLTGHLPGKGRIPAWMQVYSNAACKPDQYASQDGRYLLYRSPGRGVGQGWWLGRAVDGTASEAALAFLPRGHTEWWVLDEGNPQQAQVVISAATPSAEDASAIRQQGPEVSQKLTVPNAPTKGAPVAIQTKPRKTKAVAKASVVRKFKASGTVGEVQPVKSPRTDASAPVLGATVALNEIQTAPPAVTMDTPIPAVEPLKDTGAAHPKSSTDTKHLVAEPSSATAITETAAIYRKPAARSASPTQIRSVMEDASDSIDRIARGVTSLECVGTATLSSLSCSVKQPAFPDPASASEKDKEEQANHRTGILKKRASYNDLHCGIMAHQERGRQQARKIASPMNNDRHLGPGLFPTPSCPESGMLPRDALQRLGPRMGVIAKELQLCITPSEGCFLTASELEAQDRLLRSFGKLNMKFGSTTIGFQPVQLVVPL